MGVLVYFNPNVGCFEPLRGRVLVYPLPLCGMYLALMSEHACVYLTLTWVVFRPYVGAFLCIFNPYVGCF